jgi:psiF repeat
VQQIFYPQTKELEMNKLITAFCFMFALSPLAVAQDKKAEDKKAAAPAVTKAEEKKAAPAPAPAPAAAPAKAEEKKAAPAPVKGEGKKAAAAGEKREKGASAGKAKGEASEAQKAQRAKMTACNKEAKGKNLKGDERKKFMSTCLKG